MSGSMERLKKREKNGRLGEEQGWLVELIMFSGGWEGMWEVWPLPAGISLNLPVTCSLEGYKLFRWFCSLVNVFFPPRELLPQAEE